MKLFTALLLLAGGCMNYDPLTDHFADDAAAADADADAGVTGGDMAGAPLDGSTDDAASLPPDLACMPAASFNPSEQCNPGDAPVYTFTMSTGCLMKLCGCLHSETCTSCSRGAWMPAETDGGCP